MCTWDCVHSGLAMKKQVLSAPKLGEHHICDHLWTSAALSASCGAPAIPAESLLRSLTAAAPFSLSVVELEEKPRSSPGVTAKERTARGAGGWEERVRDFQQLAPSQFHFLRFTGHLSQTGCSFVGVRRLGCFRDALRCLSVFRIRGVEGALGCVQNCCRRVRCVAKPHQFPCVQC